MNNLRRIDLNLLLTLHALLTECHVTRAALRMHKSQPAVSHALGQLRTIFNDPLLVRRGGKLVLTARAQELMPPLTEALAQLDTLFEAPDFDAAQARRSFRLALSDYGARVVLAGVTRSLRSKAPGIDLVASLASREAMLTQLLDGEIDLALGVFPVLPGQLRAETLFIETFMCVADRSTLPANGMLALDAWLSRPHVLVATHPGADNEVDQALLALGRQRRVAVVLPHWSAANDLVAGTDLILTVAARSLDAVRADPRLLCFVPPFTISSFSFQQVWHARRDVDSAHRWLRKEISSGLGGMTVAELES